MDSTQAALAIFDHFKGQLTGAITKELDKFNIHSVLVPASCTDRLQPLDLSLNKAVKSFLRNEFHQWYSDQIREQLKNDDEFSSDELEPIAKSTARMKIVGSQWLERLNVYISNSPTLIVNGFLASGIPQSIDLGSPYIATNDNNESGSEDLGENTSDESNSEGHYESKDIYESDNDTIVID